MTWMRENSIPIFLLILTFLWTPFLINNNFYFLEYSHFFLSACFACRFSLSGYLHLFQGPCHHNILVRFSEGVDRNRVFPLLYLNENFLKYIRCWFKKKFGVYLVALFYDAFRPCWHELKRLPFSAQIFFPYEVNFQNWSWKRSRLKLYVNNALSLVDMS